METIVVTNKPRKYRVPRKYTIPISYFYKVVTILSMTFSYNNFVVFIICNQTFILANIFKKVLIKNHTNSP